MFVKINKPGNKVTNNNAGSVANLVEYLSKENDNKEIGNKWENFFNQDNDDLYKHEAISIIDGHSSMGLKKAESKYFMLTVNPSKYELNHLVDLASGHKKVTNNFNNDKITIKTDKPKKEYKELSPEQKEEFKRYLKDYTKLVMDAYARNFGKNLTSENLNYVAKLEEKREWGFRDKAVIENKNLENQIKELRKNLPKLEKTSTTDDYINSLKEKLHTLDGVVLTKENVSNSTLEANKMLLKQKAELKELLSKDSQNFLAKKADWTLNAHIVWSDSKRMLSKTLLKENEIVLKNIAELEKTGKNQAVDSINNLIQQKQNEKNKDESGSVIQVGLPKDGLQQHLHVIVNRTTKQGVRISPHGNSKGHTQDTALGKDVKIGFNHEAFKVATGELFKEQFAYQMNSKEKYQPKGLNKAASFSSVVGKGKGKAISQLTKVLGQEVAEARNYINKTKMVATVGKDIALAVASGNPMILVKSIGTKALSQVNMDLKQKLKEIITGKVLGG